MINFLRTLNEKILSHASVFEVQQKLCNNYSAVRREFDVYLALNNLRILDVGCSTGACSAAIIEMKKNTYYGIDVNPDYIKRATQLFPDGNWQSLDARQLDFQSNSFDLAMYIGVLHHMSDELALACLMETHRVIKPQGRVLIAEPTFTPGCFLSNALLSIDRGKYIRNSEGYKNLFNGFTIEREQTFKFSVHRFCSFVLKTQR
jgi:ubiquinone/menaquinone biosynthesis C-methylase UbiE